MQTIEAYKSVDGTVFENEDNAVRHDQDCIGELFDALLLDAVRATDGNVTRNDQYRMCLQLLNNRKALKVTIDKLSAYLADE